MKATTTLLITSKLRKNLLKYKTTTDKIAPSCIAISKLFKKSFCSSFNKCEDKIRCPVDDMGKNSVKPSIIPKIIESRKVICATSTNRQVPNDPLLLQEPYRSEPVHKQYAHQPG